MAKARILIVEDEGIVGLDLQRMLQNAGYYACEVVASGEKAIQKADADRPDLVLMDIFLQGELNGIEAAGQIRTRFNIPVIFITASTDKKLQEKALTTEPFGYITKPFMEENVLKVIEQTLIDR
ncbi:MAG: response regulator [Thermodesulfovibrionia bacterium]|nr:response regulator [Thermodesulfovibrionia bacterium]